MRADVSVFHSREDRMQGNGNGQAQVVAVPVVVVEFSCNQLKVAFIALLQLLPPDGAQHNTLRVRKKRKIKH